MQAVIRPMREADIAPGTEIYRHAFRAFLNIPDKMVGDADYVGTRYRLNAEGSIAAEVNGQLVGTHFATRWGSLCVFGPSTVRPVGWTGGAGKLMLEHCVEVARSWGCKSIAGFTFSHSTKHADLFQRINLWPRFLTALLSKAVRPTTARPPGMTLYSQLSEGEREQALTACARLTDSIHEGLRLDEEIRSLQRQGIGDTVLLFDGSRLEGFAACHLGLGSEAGSHTVYVKFGMVRPEATAPALFERLLLAVEALGAERKLSRLSLGMNLAHIEAYQQLLRLGFLSLSQGVALHERNDALYKRPGLHVIDDWR